MSSLVRISKLLTERNVEFIDEPGKLKCAHCKSILYNPCRLSCSCKYCHQCIDELVASGTQFCPGNSENCQSANLAQFIFDCKTSSKVLKLQVKCPEQLCSQECQLIELEDHFNKCTKKSMKCPFSNMGSEMENMVEEKVKAHFEVELCNHNRMLIEMIDNLKNEISCLKKDVVLKDRQIESVNAGVQQVLQVHDSMINEINSLTSDNAFLNAEIESLKERMNTDVLQQHISENETKWQRALQSREEKDEKTAKAIGELKESQEKCIMRLEAVQKCLNKYSNVNFKWFANFETTTQPKGNSGNSAVAFVGYCSHRISSPTVQSQTSWKYSDSFPGSPSPYKFRLAMQNHVYYQSLVVKLQILTSQSDKTLTWPFRGTITISIIDETRPKMSKSASRHCEIRRPFSESGSSSDKFKLDYADWIKVGIAIGNGMVVSCSVVED